MFVIFTVTASSKIKPFFKKIHNSPSVFHWFTAASVMFSFLTELICCGFLQADT